MIQVAAFYRFTPIADPRRTRDALRAVLAPLGLRGTLLVAPEGINGTLAGTCGAIDEGLGHLRALLGCADMPARLVGRRRRCRSEG